VHIRTSRAGRHADVQNGDCSAKSQNVGYSAELGSRNPTNLWIE
jgi:hypothetical protein